ncbi:MAG: PQQ-binding-like beta-propeller repeat protein, partial [Planctomycetota bacterium]|nr:PQQ-binding-like beta-propeller repeat protein [Planctomycetota bacterium]
VRKFLEEEEAGRYGQAIDIYREVASYISTQPSDRPHLYQAESGLYLPVEVYLRGRVISFPAEEVESFRREADLQAKPQWEEILRRGDVSRLRGFIRKNPLSSFIPRGVESLAAYHLERGEFDEVLGALAFLQRPDDWSPESKLLQRIALRSTGRSDPGGESDETPLALGGDQRSTKEILADLVEAVPLTGWRAFGGDSSHSLAPEIAFDPGRRIASGVFKEPKAARAHLDRTGEGSSSAGTPPFIPYFPIHDGRRLLFSDTFDAYCLDLRDGSLLWSHSLRKDRSVPWESTAGGHYPVAGRQAVYVTLSPREAAEVSMEEAEDAETRDFTPGEGYRVMALEISTGETLWDTSRRNDLGEDFTNAAFVSSPLLLGDRLYLLVTRLDKEASASMISLNAVTGDKIWETHLCTAFSPLILGRGLRGAYLAGGKSRVYASTNLGAVGCLDAATGEVIWIRAYDRYPAATLDDFLEAGREPPAEAPILTDAALFAAPSDSPYLYSLDRDNGRVLWRFERGKEEALIGVRGETAILAGDGVLGLQVETGRVAWRVDELAGALAGRPAIGGDLLYVPTTTGLFLHQASDGTAAGQYIWSNSDEEAGNILFAGPRMLTISRLRVNIYEDRADTLRKLSALPPFPARHGESELLLRRGNARQAIRVLEGTVPLAKDEAEREAVRQSLARAHLTLGEKAVGRGDLPAAVASFEESARHRQPADRAALLLRIGGIHESIETPDKALPAYRMILMESFELFASTGGLPSHAAILASARIRRLVEKHGRGIYEPFERRAGRELAMAKKLGNLSGYQKVVAAYPNSAAAREASLAIAEIYEGLDQYTLGASHLAELIRRHPDVAPDIYRKLASLYERSGRPGRARKTLLSLAAAGETGIEIAEEIERLEASGGDLPDVSPASRLLWRSTTSLSPMGLQILIPESPRMADLFVVSSGGAIEVHDVRTGLLRWRRTGLSGGRRNRAVVQGDRILLPDPDQAGIIAVDLLTGDEV